MLVTFDIKFIRLDQKQHRNGKACRASPACFWLILINLKSKDTIVVFCIPCIISRFSSKKDSRTDAKQMQLCSNSRCHDCIMI